MARIPQNLVEEIREHVNIVDVVSPYVQLKNKDVICLKMSISEERTPSFSVNEETNSFIVFHVAERKCF